MVTHQLNVTKWYVGDRHHQSLEKNSQYICVRERADSGILPLQSRVFPNWRIFTFPRFESQYKTYFAFEENLKFFNITWLSVMGTDFMASTCLRLAASCWLSTLHNDVTISVFQVATCDTSLNLTEGSHAKCICLDLLFSSSVDSLSLYEGFRLATLIQLSQCWG